MSQHQHQQQMSGSAVATLLYGGPPTKRRPVSRAIRRGYRADIEHMGGQPIDHIRANKKSIKLKQRQLCRQKEIEKEAATHIPEPFVMPRFRDVPSRVFTKSPASEPRPTKNSITKSPFLRKGQGINMSTPYNSSRTSSRASLHENSMENTMGKKTEKMTESTLNNPTQRQLFPSPSTDVKKTPSSQRKPPVPSFSTGAIQPPPIHHRNINFIRENALQACHATPNKQSPKTDDINKTPFDRKGYGQIPDYLRKRQMIWSKIADKKRIHELDPDCPPGMIPMEDDERIQTLQLLLEKREQIKAQINRLPLIIETPSAIRRKNELEATAKEFEDAVQIFSRNRVYIKDDEHAA